MRALCIKSCVLLICSGWAFSVSADVQITEIMYDRDGTDSGYEWIEVVNRGKTVLFSDWTFLENKVDHRIVPVSEEEDLASGERAILADDPEKFLEDVPLYSGQLFDSSFSLSNSGEALSLVNPSDESIDTVVYDPAWGAEGNGASLQLQDSGVWIEGIPTPGKGNTQEAFEEPEKNETEDTQSDNSDDIEFEEIESAWPFEDDIFITAGSNRRVFEDEKVIFEAQARRRNGGEVYRADFTWIFGDGDQARGRRVEHIFDFPGIYSIVLTAETPGGLLTDRVVIEVLEKEIDITNANKSSVTITNNLSHEMEIGEWSIAAEGQERKERTVTFPPYTYIRPATDLTVSFALPEDTEQVILANPTNETVDTYVMHTSSETPNYREQREAYQTRIDELFAQLEALQ